MKQTDRPAQIAAFLKTVESEYPADMRASLDAYIADLKAKQPEQPDQITAILKSIKSENPVGKGASLDTYVSDLEVKPQVIPSSKGNPNSLNWRSLKRDLQQRERALRKQINNQ